MFISPVLDNNWWSKVIVSDHQHFRFHIPKAIKQGKIKFETTKKPTMDIDKHSFLGVHMVEFQLAKGKTKVLTPTTAREDG